jgi:hypothetical protein
MVEKAVKKTTKAKKVMSLFGREKMGTSKKGENLWENWEK